MLSEETELSELELELSGLELELELVLEPGPVSLIGGNELGLSFEFRWEGPSLNKREL